MTTQPDPPTPKDTEAERLRAAIEAELAVTGDVSCAGYSVDDDCCYVFNLAARIRAVLAASPAVTEGERAPEEWKPRAGYMHPVDESFYRLAIKERDYERLRANRLAEEVALLKAALPASPAVPAAEDETECPACRAGIAPWECGRPAPAVPAVPAEESREALQLEALSHGYLMDDISADAALAARRPDQSGRASEKEGNDGKHTGAHHDRSRR